MTAFGIAVSFAVLGAWFWPRKLGRWIADVEKGYRDALKEDGR